MSARIEARVFVPADHPSLPGHFPGQPVVPGVLLLERLIEAAEHGMGSAVRVLGMPQVKFIAPLLPGEEVVAVMEWQGGQHARSTSQTLPADDAAPQSAVAELITSLRFRVERAGQTIAQGAFQVALDPSMRAATASAGL